MSELLPSSEAEELRLLSTLRALFREPSEAMESIAAARPWGEGLVLAVLLAAFGGLVEMANPTRPRILGDPDLSEEFRSFLAMLFSPWWVAANAFLFCPASLLLSSGICYGCGRLLAGRGSFASLLATQSFALVPAAIQIVVSFVFNELWAPQLGTYYSIVTCIWVLVLSVIGIRASLGLSTGRAIVAMISPFFILTPLLVCSVFALFVGLNSAGYFQAVSEREAAIQATATRQVELRTPTQIPLLPFPVRSAQRTPTAVFPGPVTGQPQIRKVDLATNDLVFDPYSRMLYASVPSGVNGLGNSVVPINPQTGALGAHIPVGGEPNLLALSDDGHYLYVALEESAAIVRFNLWSQKVDFQFPLGGDEGSGPFVARSITVLPGQPEVIAVARASKNAPAIHKGVSIYLNGVQLPVTTAANSNNPTITFCDMADVLYGYNDASTEFGLHKLSVGDMGVREVGVQKRVFSGASLTIQCANRRLYATSGQVVDAASLALVGTFKDVSAQDAPARSVYADANGQVLFLGPYRESGQRGYRLLIGDARTFRTLWTLDLPGILPDEKPWSVAKAPGSLRRWGTDGVAFRASSEQIWLVRASQIAGQPAATLPFPQQHLGGAFGAPLTAAVIARRARRAAARMSARAAATREIL